MATYREDTNGTIQTIQCCETGETLSVQMDPLGSSNVQYNENKIPAARIWALIVDALSEKVRPSRDELFKEARRANIFRLHKAGKIVYTDNPKATDQPMAENIYWRDDSQRVRPLANELGLVPVSVETDINPLVVRELAALRTEHGLLLVATIDGRFFLERQYEENEESRTYDQFESTNWLSIAKILKRSGSTSVEVNWTAEEDQTNEDLYRV